MLSLSNLKLPNSHAHPTLTISKKTTTKRKKKYRNGIPLLFTFVLGTSLIISSSMDK
jgi:hypothetical protein